ncbi:MAG: hypothetical protein FD164_1201 [Nitrospirae bacterium]|nr:MAG: hypothetical protein FD164_1201 [Nitrospirota bacterium]
MNTEHVSSHLHAVRATIFPMPHQPLAEIVKSHREVAVCSGADAALLHQDLYRLADGAYIALTEGTSSFPELAALIQECEDDRNCREFRLHVTVGWEALLHLAAGKNSLRWPDIFLALKDAGVKPEEMHPFRDAPVVDIFPWLYYAKRFDVLRKLCLSVKRKLDMRFAARDIRTVCHLIGDFGGGKIVASSL